MRGFDQVCGSLSECGAELVFGVPGTQNIALFDAMHQAGIECVTTSNELAAAFAANGYARGSGRCAVLATIPGPGFTYALSGIAEARLDSVPVVWLLTEPVPHPTRKFQLQQLEQESIVSPLVKGYLKLGPEDDAGQVMRSAFDLAQSEEPGPVIVELARALKAHAGPSRRDPAVLPDQAAAGAAPDALPGKVIHALRESKRPLLFLGQGAQGLRKPAIALRQKLGACVITSTSGRGVVSEDDPSVLRTDLCAPETLNGLLEESDLVLALGVKLSHNGSLGFGLKIPEERFIHIDSCPSVLNANYPASQALAMTAEDFLTRANAALGERAQVSGWPLEQLEGWQGALDASYVFADSDPVLPDMSEIGMPEFFRLLRSAMPIGAQLITDSGMHQMYARGHYKVLEQRGLLVPTDFQSMGYAIPAGIGAKAADPDRPVAVLVGDGGVGINGLELLTAVRRQMPLPVLVFVDRHFGLIRHQQIEAFGRTTEVGLQALDLKRLAESMGAAYAKADDAFTDSFSAALSHSGPTIIEVRLQDSPAMDKRRKKRAAVEAAYRKIGPGRIRALKRFLKKISGRGD